MQQRIQFWLVTGLAAWLGSGCMIYPTIQGDGHVVTEVREVSGFQAVSIGGSGKAVITQGDSERLEIRADENLLPYIQSEVDGGKLRISFRRGNLRFSEGPVYVLTVRELERLELSGSLAAELARLETPRLDAGISGSGRIDIGALQAGTVHLGVSGSGTVRIEDGAAESLHISVSGSGDARAPNFRVTEAEVGISGSGSADLWVTESLEVRVSGSGSVEYRGSPRVSSSISGSGKVRQR